MTEKKQIKLGTIEKRVEFIEMQTAEDISNIDKIYKILERLEKKTCENNPEDPVILTRTFVNSLEERIVKLEKRLDLLQPRGIIDQ